MKPVVIAAASLALAAGASAELCVPTSLIGGETVDHIFDLYARTEAGDELPVTSGAATDAEPFYFPAKLGAKGEKKSKLPYFELQGGVTYADGGEVLATKNSSLLTPEKIYLGADSSEVEETFMYINATCDGTTEKLLRFANITPLPLASAAIDGTFEEGAALYSPVLDNLLDVYTPVDLVIRRRH